MRSTEIIAPMLLTSGEVPVGQTWSLEIKWDGCRAQLRYDGRTMSLRTRHAIPLLPAA